MQKYISSIIKKTLLTFYFFLLAACGSDHRNGSFTIGFDVHWFGIDFMGQQNNVTAFTRELLKEIGKTQKMKLTLLPVNWDVLLPDLKAERYNGALSYIYP